MNNKDTSGFDFESFEKHAKKVLISILNSQKPISIVTEKERLLVENKTLLRNINNTLEPSLYRLILETETYIYPSDLALFFITASKENLMNEAAEILDSAVQDRRLMSLNDLLSALAATANMPGTWAAAMYG